MVEPAPTPGSRAPRRPVTQPPPPHAPDVLARAWRLDHALDTDVLGRALGALTPRAGEEASEPPTVVDVPDLSALRDLLAARAAARPDPSAARAATGTDPSAPPRPRVELFRLGTRDHVLVVSAGRGPWDGWAEGVFRRELGALYAREAHASPPSAPARPRGRAARRRVTPEAPPLPRPAADRFTAAVVRHRWDPAVLAGVEALARRCRVPRFVVLLAGLEVLLARWSGAPEVTVLMAHHGAVDPTPPERAGRRPADPVALLRRAYRPDEPFDALVVREAARPGLDPDGAPASPTRFSFRVVGEPAPLTLPGVAVTEVTPLLAHGGPRPAPCDMSLDVTATDLVLRYAEELFDEATVRLFARHYGDLLAAAVADPSAAVGSIPFAPPARAVRAPGALAALLGTLPDAPGGAATGARIIDDTDGTRLPVGLRGRLQLEVRSAAGARRWVDTAAFGWCTPRGGILLDRLPAPPEPAPSPPARRTFRGDAAAGMASQLAVLWAQKLGLAPAGP
ncbi:hypothetical protein ACFWBH_23090 [Streptomyces sp. NPDC059999]|uniref:hypothetical protein n=1 Tax=Streptomyces sp. NPDC059999 TaxID=3347030 RepID=UPI003691F778